jgi:hypothetical protein
LIFSPRKDWDSEISPQNWKAALLIMTYILART